MINKDMRRLSRRELVDIIYQLKKNEEKLQAQVAALEEAVQDKRIRIAIAGSIADAAATVTDLFATAQSTADLYLQEIACMKEQTQTECDRLLEEARKEAAQILADSKKAQTEDIKN